VIKHCDDNIGDIIAEKARSQNTHTNRRYNNMLIHNKKFILNNMKNMPIEEIVELYKIGYRLDESFSNTTQLQL